MIGADKTKDDSLILAVKAGDEHAYDQIFNYFYPALCFFARRFIPANGAAEEIAQDVLFKLWQKRIDFNDFSAVKAFLYISTKNACLDSIDQEQRKLKRDHNWYLEHENIEPALEERIIQTEVLLQIAQAIDQLPDQCRKIMKMSYEQGLSGKEIAEQMQLTVSTVNNQKARGIALLRKNLKPESFFLVAIALKYWLV